MEYYISNGDSGRTFVIATDEGPFLNIEWPNADVENEWSLLEQYENWNLGRYKSQFDLEEVSEQKFFEEVGLPKEAVLDEIAQLES